MLLRRLALVLKRVAAARSCVTASSHVSLGLAALRERSHYVVHCGNLIVLGAINQTDMLDLRILSVVASSFGIAYNLLQPRPLIAPACWGVFFIACHFYYISELIRERREMTLTDDEDLAYNLAFVRAGFTKQQFCDLLSSAGAQWNTFQQGSFVHKRGDVYDNITLLLEGTVLQLSATNDKIADVDPRTGWLGHMFDPGADPERFAAQRRHFSWKCTAERCRTLSLYRADFHQHVTAHPKLREAATRMQSDDYGLKLCKLLPQNRLETYRKMVEMALIDGKVDEPRRKLLQDWRSRHKISDKEHFRLLKEIGWSAQEFDSGKRTMMKDAT